MKKELPKNIKEKNSNTPLLSDLVDIQKTTEMLSKLYSIIQIPISVIDNSLKNIIVVGEKHICDNIHFCKANILSACKESQMKAIEELQTKETYQFRCNTGMYMVGIRIRIEEKNIAHIFIGPFRKPHEAIDFSKIKKISSESNASNEKFTQLFLKLPLVSEEYINSAIQHFNSLAKLLTFQGYANHQLKDEIKKKDIIEANLVHDEEKMRLLLEAMPIPVYYKDRNGVYTGCNSSFEQFVKKSRNEILGKTTYDISTKEHADSYTKSDEELFNGNQNKQAYETRVRQNNGEESIVINYKSRYIFDGQMGLIGAIIDISDIHKANQNLSEKDDFFQNLTESMRDLLCVINPDGSFVYSNPAHYEVLGYNPQQIATMSLFDMFNKDDLREFIKVIAAVPITEKTSKIQVRLRNIDGKETWFESSVRLFHENKERPAKFIISSRDISDRKDAEAARADYLRNNEFLTQTALEFVSFSSSKKIYDYIAKKLHALNPNAYIIVNQGNKTTDTLTIRSMVAPEILIKKAKDIIGGEFVGIPFKKVEVLKNIMTGELIDIGTNISIISNLMITEENAQKLIELFQIENILTIGFTAEDNLLATAVFIIPKGQHFEKSRTVKTFVKQASIALQKMKAEEERERAIESDKFKSIFLANMSHEIRTPMNGILGFCQLLKQDDLSKNEKEEYLLAIDQNSKHLLHILNDLIDISRIESGQMVINEEKISVNKTIDNLYKDLEQIKKFNNKEHLRVSIVKSINEDCQLITDPMRLQQVMQNLLSNAVKFTNEGSIEFGYEKDKQNTIRFFVKDTGCGIPEEFHPLMFERFKQADIGFTRKFGGNGLGLSISKELVDLMGGRIWFESANGKGSSFYFSIPNKSTL